MTLILRVFLFYNRCTISSYKICLNSVEKNTLHLFYKNKKYAKLREFEIHYSFQITTDCCTYCYNTYTYLQQILYGKLDFTTLVPTLIKFEFYLNNILLFDKMSISSIIDDCMAFQLKIVCLLKNSRRI